MTVTIFILAYLFDFKAVAGKCYHRYLFKSEWLHFFCRYLFENKGFSPKCYHVTRKLKSYIYIYIRTEKKYIHLYNIFSHAHIGIQFVVTWLHGNRQGEKPYITYKYIYKWCYH